MHCLELGLSPRSQDGGDVGAANIATSYIAVSSAGSKVTEARVCSTTGDAPWPSHQRSQQIGSKSQAINFDARGEERRGEESDVQLWEVRIGHLDFDCPFLVWTDARGIRGN